MKPLPLLPFLFLMFYTAIIAQDTYTKDIQATDDVFLYHMALTADDNIIVATNAPGTSVSLGFDLSKLTPDGNLLWSKKYTLNNNLEISSAKILPAKHDDFFVLTPVSTSFSSKGVLLSKADSNGNILWAKRINLSSDNYESTALDIAETNDGDIYLVNLIYDYGIGIQKLDKDGEPIWEKYLFSDSTVDMQTRFGPICITNDDGLIVTTTSFERYGNKYYNHLFKFSKEGLPEWQYSANQPSDSYIYLWTLLSKDRGVVNLLYSKFGRYKYVILDPLTGNSKGYDLGTSIFDIQFYLRNNKIHTYDGYSFAPSTYSTYGFTKKWNVIKASDYETQHHRYITRIEKFDSLGRICPDYLLPVTEGVTEKIKFPFTKSSFNLGKFPDSFRITKANVLVETFDGIKTVCSGTASGFSSAVVVSNLSSKGPVIGTKIFPNPAKDYVNIILDGTYSGPLKIDITGINGNIVKSISFILGQGQNSKKLNIADLPNAMYFLKFTTNHGFATQKLFKQ